MQRKFNFLKMREEEIEIKEDVHGYKHVASYDGVSAEIDLENNHQPTESAKQESASPHEIISEVNYVVQVTFHDPFLNDIYYRKSDSSGLQQFLLSDRNHIPFDSTSVVTSKESGRMKFVAASSPARTIIKTTQSKWFSCVGYPFSSSTSLDTLKTLLYLSDSTLEKLYLSRNFEI
jgi:hypothetical protein